MKIKLFSGILIAILFLAVISFVNRSNKEEVAKNQNIKTTEELAENITPQKLIFGLPEDSFNIHQATIQPNEFLANILLRYNVDYFIIDELSKKSIDVFDVRKIRAGNKYTILANKDSSETAAYFIYQPNEVDYIIYNLQDSITIQKAQKEVEVRIEHSSGIIQSSLYESLRKNNDDPNLAISLAEIFAWSIDFYRIQKGDEYKIIYERQYVDDIPVGNGKILAVEFNHFDKNFQGYYFEQAEKSDYFDEEANSLRKAFLKSPLKYSRLTSGYTPKRFHPIQKRWKAHLGTDYAAPAGTPIMSTGDGHVIASSYTGGNGNYVKIKHNSVYTTQYLHMSKRNVKVGDYVKQGDIIGFVGSTGLATGPHVCYRFWKNGHQINHLGEDFPSAEPVMPEYKEEFQLKMKELKHQLDQIQMKPRENVLVQIHTRL